jgi:hypothetical protein
LARGDKGKEVLGEVNVLVLKDGEAEEVVKAKGDAQVSQFETTYN